MFMYDDWDIEFIVSVEYYTNNMFAFDMCLNYKDLQ